MENRKQNREHEWIERVKSKGSVPCLDPERSLNTCWMTPPAKVFTVRGAKYLKTKAKTPGTEYLLKPLGFEWIKGPTKTSEILNNPKSRIRRALDNECPEGQKPFVWAFNFQLPTKDNNSIVSYFVDTEHEHEHDDSLKNRFLKEDDGFKNSRLKLIVNVVKGPWVVKKAIGEQAICLVGRSLACRYCKGENFMEVDIDVGSSVLATAVVHVAFGYFANMTVDIAYVIEGRAESELPERILGAVRFSKIDGAEAKQVEPGSEE